MKYFTKFATFFVLFASSCLSFGFMILAIVDFADYLDASIKIVKNAYLSSCGGNLVAAFIILILGFALSSIIYLLRCITDKHQVSKDDIINE